MVHHASGSAMKTRYIPAGSARVADKRSDAVAYLYLDKRGKPCAIIYYGAQSKPVGHHGYRSESAREAGVRSYFESRQAADMAKAEYKAKRLAPNRLTVGDILVSSWGYDQTNVDFYEVTKVAGQYVIIRSIQSAVDHTSDMTARCVPQSGQFVGDPMRKLVQYGDRVTIASYSTASLWNTSRVAGVPIGPAMYSSSYA
jgi:hypothetical protein